MYHLLFPRESNSHRPKVLHHSILSVLVIVLLGLSVILPRLQNAFPSVLGISVNVTTKDLLDATNRKRVENGLNPLKLDSELSKAASDKAAHMVTQNYWAHIAPDGTTPWFFIKNSGYQYLYAGENLARGFNDASEVVDAWMNSPSHRENLLSSNYTDIGFAETSGILTGTETVLVVQMFGSRYQEASSVAGVGEVEVVVDGSEREKDEVVPIPLINTEQKQDSQPIVAAAVNNPLIDSKSGMRDLSIWLMAFFIFVLAADAVIIERKKIARIASHNIDHIIFLTIILLAAIIIGGGMIL